MEHPVRRVTYLAPTLPEAAALFTATAEAAAAAFFPDFFFAAMTDSGDLEVGSADNYECAMQSLPAQKVTDKYLPHWCSMCF